MSLHSVRKGLLLYRTRAKTGSPIALITSKPRRSWCCSVSSSNTVYKASLGSLLSLFRSTSATIFEKRKTQSPAYVCCVLAQNDLLPIICPTVASLSAPKLTKVEWQTLLFIPTKTLLAYCACGQYESKSRTNTSLWRAYTSVMNKVLCHIASIKAVSLYHLLFSM
jgi:hypothetical protein